MHALCAGLSGNLTLHMSFTFSGRDLTLLPNLVNMANVVATFAPGCIAELLITIDTIQKTRGALNMLFNSSFGNLFIEKLCDAVSMAESILAGVRGTTSLPFRWPSTEASAMRTCTSAPWIHVEFVDYGNPKLLNLVLGKVLGIAHDEFMTALPVLAKHTVAHAFAIASCWTQYLLQFDCDTMSWSSVHSGPSMAWFTPSLPLFWNSSWLSGLFAISLEDCVEEYGPGVIDLVQPLRADTSDDFFGYETDC